MEFGEVGIKIKSLLGVAKPFQQGGVWRLTIPKGAVKGYNLEEKVKREKYFSWIFLDTDKGILLLPLEEVVNPINIRKVFLERGFFGEISPKEIEELFEEE